jgi:hypothetical protein
MPAMAAMAPVDQEGLGHVSGDPFLQQERDAPGGSLLDYADPLIARADGVAVDDFETGGVPLGLPTAPSRDPMVKGRVVHEPGAGLFCAPHGIGVDSAGSFYVADTAESWIGLDRGSRGVQKFVRM